MRIKTRYGKVLKGIRSGKEKLENVRLDDLNVVIPADHISSVSYFNTGIEHLFDEEVPTVSNDPNGEDFLASDQ